MEAGSGMKTPLNPPSFSVSAQEKDIHLSIRTKPFGAVKPLVLLLVTLTFRLQIGPSPTATVVPIFHNVSIMATTRRVRVALRCSAAQKMVILR